MPSCTFSQTVNVKDQFCANVQNVTVRFKIFIEGDQGNRLPIIVDALTDSSGNATASHVMTQNRAVFAVEDSILKVPDGYENPTTPVRQSQHIPSVGASATLPNWSFSIKKLLLNLT